MNLILQTETDSLAALIAYSSRLLSEEEQTSPTSPMRLGQCVLLTEETLEKVLRLLAASLACPETLHF